MTAFHLVVGSEYGNGQGKIIGAALLPEIRRSHVYRNVCNREFVSDILTSCCNTVTTLLHGAVRQSCEMVEHTSRHAHFDGYGGNVQAVYGCTECFY